MTATLSPGAILAADSIRASLQEQTSPDLITPSETNYPGRGTSASPEAMHRSFTSEPPPLGKSSSPTKSFSPSKLAASAGNQATTSGQAAPVTHHLVAAGGLNIPDGHQAFNAQNIAADRDQTSPPDQRPCDGHRTPVGRGPILADPLLALLADAVDDLEQVRIATENRFRQLTRTETDSDGEERGFGLSIAVPEVKRVRDIADGLAALEKQAILSLKHQIRRHPLWKAWGKDQLGVGEKQAARLFAAIGDPYWNTLHDRPRTVSELWAYCGLHVVHPGGHLVVDTHQAHAAGVAPRRQRGQKSNWNATARMRVWLVASSCVLVKRPEAHYRQVYDAARVKYEGALHSSECARCGPKNSPALPGSPLSAGHQQARAVRAIGKEILRDLWLAAREIHQS